METRHYIVENMAKFSEQTEAVKKLQTYLDYIEEIFSVIEEVFGQVWNDGQIKITLNNSTGGAEYCRSGDSHVVKIGINNRNIQKNYPENLWGCLFHETHHAFFNPIIRNKKDKKIFNGGCKGEPFNHAFMAITYLKLKEKGIIDTKLYEHFLDKLHRELPDGARDLFKEYVNLFSINENFAKFISYVKSSNSVFTDVSNFRQDLDKAKELLEKLKRKVEELIKENNTRL